MKKNKFKYICYLLITLLLSPFWLVGLFLLKNSVFPTWEGGNLSDWASTLCNAVMAVSAVYAIIKAKDFISAKLHSDAYELSKKIIVFQTNDLMFALTKSIGKCIEIRDILDNSTLRETKRIESKLDELLDHISTISNIRDDITSNLRVLNKLGFSMVQSCNSLYKDHSHNIDLFFHCIMDCSTTFLSIITDKNNLEKTVHANTEITNLINLHLECSISHNAFYYHKDGFFKYFTPRK